MNNLKFGVLACGLVGLIACFLPYVSFGEMSASLFKMREMPGASGDVYLTIGGFVAGLAMGGMAAGKPPMQRWQSIVALVGFGLVLFIMREGLPLEWLTMTGSGIGMKLIGITSIAGVVFSILTLAKPETAN